jgi:hypothetical protein
MVLVVDGVAYSLEDDPEPRLRPLHQPQHHAWS